MNFDAASRFAGQIGRYILDNSLPYDTLLNVNVPDIPLKSVKGIKFTRQGKRVYEGSVHETFDPHGEKHYWIEGERLSGSTVRIRISRLFLKTIYP